MAKKITSPKGPQGPRRFVALFDIHCGYETRQAPNGGRFRAPTHSEEVLRTVFKFIEDFQPDTVILGGDQLEIGAISDWNRGKPRLVEGLRVQDDYEALEGLILSPLDRLNVKTKVWLTGNHENRVRRFLNVTPGVEGLLEPENYLRLAARGWLCQPEEVPYQVGKVYFVHGHAKFPRGCGVGPAAKLVSHYRRSIRCGHLHTYDVATDITAADRRDYHTGIVVPALARVNPSYLNNSPSNYQQGFLYGYVLPDGNFNDYVVVINDGMFTVGGSTYGAPLREVEECALLPQGTSPLERSSLMVLWPKALDFVKENGYASYDAFRSRFGIGTSTARTLIERLLKEGVLQERPDYKRGQSTPRYVKK